MSDQNKIDDGGPIESEHIQKDPSGYCTGWTEPSGGLTKREYFAAVAMGPVEKSLGESISIEEFARRCIKVADALISELKKGGA